MLLCFIVCLEKQVSVMIVGQTEEKSVIVVRRMGGGWEEWEWSWRRSNEHPP